MIKIAITGGIGCGKTTVSKIFFEKFKIPTIDTDILARQAVSKTSKGLKQVVDYFGANILDDQGELDRLKVKKIIFTDNIKKKELEGIIHPIVHQLIIKQLEIVTANFCFVAIPILRKDSSILSLVDRILFVDCKESIRIRRTMERDNLEASLVKNIIQNQPSRTELCQIADDIIENNGSLIKLNKEIVTLKEMYSTLVQN